METFKQHYILNWGKYLNTLIFSRTLINENPDNVFGMYLYSDENYLH